jgi:hypothetical protein
VTDFLTPFPSLHFLKMFITFSQVGGILLDRAFAESAQCAARPKTKSIYLKEVFMYRGGFLLRFVFTLVIIGLLAAGGVALYRFGWGQGYQTAALTAASAIGQDTGGAQVAPPPPYYGYGPWLYRPHWFGYGPGFGFFPFFPLFGIGFFLILLFLFGGLFRRWAWGPGPYRWGPEAEREWRERHGRPEEPSEDKTTKE